MSVCRFLPLRCLTFLAAAGIKLRVIAHDTMYRRVRITFAGQMRGEMAAAVQSILLNMKDDATFRIGRAYELGARDGNKRARALKQKLIKMEKEIGTPARERLALSTPAPGSPLTPLVQTPDVSPGQIDDKFRSQLTESRIEVKNLKVERADLVAQLSEAHESHIKEKVRMEKMLAHFTDKSIHAKKAQFVGAYEEGHQEAAESVHAHWLVKSRNIFVRLIVNKTRRSLIKEVRNWRANTWSHLTEQHPKAPHALQASKTLQDQHTYETQQELEELTAWKEQASVDLEMLRKEKQIIQDQLAVHEDTEADDAERSAMERQISTLIDECTELKTSLAARERLLDELKEDHRKENEDLCTALEDAKAKHESASEQIVAAAESKTSELESKLKCSVDLCESLRSELDSIRGQASKDVEVVKASSAKEMEELKQLSAVPESLMQELKTSLELNESLTMELEDVRRTMEGNAEQHVKALEDAKAVLDDVKAKHLSAREETDQVQLEMKALTSELSENRFEIKLLKEKVSESQTRVAKETYDALQTKYREAESKHNEVQHSYVCLEKKLEFSEKANVELQLKLDQMSESHMELEQHVSQNIAMASKQVDETEALLDEKLALMHEVQTLKEKNEALQEGLIEANDAVEFQTRALEQTRRESSAKLDNFKAETNQKLEQLAMLQKDLTAEKAALEAKVVGVTKERDLYMQGLDTHKAASEDLIRTRTMVDEQKEKAMKRDMENAALEKKLKDLDGEIQKSQK